MAALLSPPLAKEVVLDSTKNGSDSRWRSRLRNPWQCSLYTLGAMFLGFATIALMAESFLTRQLDVKGCEMAWMRPSYYKFDDFDTEHTRFAGKYSLYLYREGGVDEDLTVKGVPVLFIPGNAGSYKQVRSLASEAAYHYQDVLRDDAAVIQAGKRRLDFFSVDFNEDFTAFHGQTLLDQAEYLNDAILYILSLYHTPGRFYRDSTLPDPTSVIIIGHSMGGVVARTMLTMPNYPANSINTIITLAAPHARPPVSFDGDTVRIYNTVNNYWRNAHLQKWASDNPLWHVTLISIAGGGLDTIVSSDYASVESIVPETHGFTVFTSSMPNVWTGMDHLAITWCDQNRKSIVRALYDIVDASRAKQTVSRADRMRSFKRWFLTGLEDNVEKSLQHKQTETLLIVDEKSVIIPVGERLVLRSLGQSMQRPSAYLLPISHQDPQQGRFTLLTNEKLDAPGEHGVLEVLFCSAFKVDSGQSIGLFTSNMDLANDSESTARYACTNAASDVIILPASTSQSTFPFLSDQPPFSYLQYELKDLAGFQFVAVLDKAGEQRSGWAIAEFSTAFDSRIKIDMSLQRLLMNGLSVQLPARRPLISEIKAPALHSGLLAYSMRIDTRPCESMNIFAPLLRQYITNVYESKFFVNVQNASVNLHGVSPYMPPALHAEQHTEGLSLQIWSDPTCDRSTEILLRVDILGSIGKLWMRYRIVFAAFPLLVVALVVRHQFSTYDNTGIFMSFAQGLNECVVTSLPLTLVALTLLSITLSGARRRTRQSRTSAGLANATTVLDDTSKELLLGSDDPFFWFLVPLFGLMCIAICAAVNYVALLLQHISATVYSFIRPNARQFDEVARSHSAFAVASTRQRVITTCVLLSLVSTVIPYHFVFVVLCLVQLATAVRALTLARTSRLDTSYNFYNYAHSIFILMLWILPINLPVLVVWVRNLAIHWLTPFSSHHNILSIMPFVFLVETLSTGRMIPRVQLRISILTNVFLFTIGAYAALYGVTYAYVLHHLTNMLCAWLVAIHFDAFDILHHERQSLPDSNVSDSKAKNRP